MDVKILFLIAFLDGVGMALVLPLVNPHVLSLGGSLSLVGLLSSIGSGAQLFASPIIGSWSDTRGRKLILLVTLATVFISNILLGFSSLAIFFIARILYGAAHQTDPLIKAMISDNVPKEKLTETFNKLMAIGGSSFLIAPVIGGILYELLQNFRYISIILCALDITVISISFLFIEEQAKPKKENEQDTTVWESIRSDLGKTFKDLKNVDWQKYGNLLAIKFFLDSSFHLLFVNLGVILRQKFGFTQTQLGLSITYMSVVMIGSNFLSAFVTKTLYKSDSTGFQRILHGFVLSLLLFCMVPFANNSWLYLGILAPVLASKALAESSWMEVLTKTTTEKDKGVMMGAATSMLSLAGLVCPLIGGLTGDFIGITAVSILPIFPAIYGTVVVRKVKRQASVEKRD